jgi:DNA-binding CsgD family transcriptional regulator
VLVGDPDADAAALEQDLEKLYQLTRREAQVASLLSRGLKTAEIAERLRIGAEAVHTHLNRALEKTGAHRQPELVRLLLLGVVPRKRIRGRG